MNAYPDSKCSYGFMCICDRCIRKGGLPSHVNVQEPIINPPTLGVSQRCEVCGRMRILRNPYTYYKSSPETGQREVCFTQR